MKRLVTIAAALVIAGMTSPSFAHQIKRKHAHKKPVAAKTVNKTEESKALKMKPAEPVAKTPAVNETKPVVAAPSQPSATETTTNKAMDVAKDKAMDTATGGVKATTPTPSTSGVDPTAAAAKSATGSMPTTPNVAAPVAK